MPVPAGVEDGQTVRMAVGNNEIFITFKVESSDYFKRDGPDVHTDCTVSINKFKLLGSNLKLFCSNIKLLHRNFILFCIKLNYLVKIKKRFLCNSKFIFIFFSFERF